MDNKITELCVLIDSIEKVKRFVEITNRAKADAELVSAPYTVDAKSIMGVFSLDLSKPVTVHIHGSENDVNVLADKIWSGGFIVD